MAELKTTTPEEGHQAFHLPPPSIWPPVLALGIAFILTGLVVTPVLLVIGAILGVAAVALWVRDARHEFEELPE
jgi:Cytochrome c oxidase subunit IV